MKILNMNIGQWGKIRAFFDVETSEGFVMKGFKLSQNKKTSTFSFLRKYISKDNII